jgi:uncharacterized membrane protein YccC
MPLVIQYRVIDTIIGSTIAVAANYILLPSWEAYNLKQVLLNAFKMNKEYLLATQVVSRSLPTQISLTAARKNISCYQ